MCEPSASAAWFSVRLRFVWLVLYRLKVSLESKTIPFGQGALSAGQPAWNVVIFSD